MTSETAKALDSVHALVRSRVAADKVRRAIVEAQAALNRSVSIR